MPTFQYQAVRRNGEPKSGQVEAVSRKVARDLLISQDLFPTKIYKTNGDGFWGFLTRDMSDPARAYRDGLAPVTVQLARLLEAGITVDQALSVLAEGGLSRAWTLVITDVRDAVRQGMSLSVAIGQHSLAFPSHYVALLAAGERSGTIAATLNRLALMVGRRDDTRNKIKTALLYPSLLLALSVCSVLFVLFFVLPQFESLLREGWANLPWSTKFLFGLKNVLMEFWWMLLALVLGGALLAYRLQNDASFLAWRDRVLLNTLFVGPFLVKLEAERLCHTVSGLLAAGLPVPDAFALAADGATNRYVGQVLNDVVAQVKRGHATSFALSHEALLPLQIIQLAKSGEDAGKLAEMLQIGADLLGAQIETQIDRMLSILTPALTVLMGVIVGATVTSVFAALLSVNELVF